MMNLRVNSWLLFYFFPLFLLLAAGCRKDPRLYNTYFIVGSYSVWIDDEGGCEDMFMLRNGKVYRDCNNKRKAKFERKPLPDGKVVIMQELLDSLPAFLLEHPNKTYGEPGARDQDGFSISLKTKGKKEMSWNLDSDEHALPSELVAYVRMLKEELPRLAE